VEDLVHPVLGAEPARGERGGCHLGENLVPAAEVEDEARSRRVAALDRERSSDSPSEDRLGAVDQVRGWRLGHAGLRGAPGVYAARTATRTRGGGRGGRGAVR